MKAHEISPANNDYMNALIDEDEASRFLGYTKRSMQNWRFRGGGPPFIRISARSIRYRRRDLIEWINTKVRANTSHN